MSRQYCWDSLRAELDACNTGGENGKHGKDFLPFYRQGGHLLTLSSFTTGGYRKYDCLTFVLDPEPDLHWPYPYQLLN